GDREQLPLDLGPERGDGGGVDAGRLTTRRRCRRRRRSAVRGPVQDLPTQPLGLLLLEEGEDDRRAGAARRLDLQLGPTEEAREERLDDVHRLDAVEARVALLAEEDAAVEEDGVAPDGVAHHPPRQHRVHGEDEEEQEDGAATDEQDERPVDGVAVLPHLGEELGVLPDQHREERDDDLPRVEDGRDLVDAPPVDVLLGSRLLLGAHRPASLDSPRSLRRSRSREASSGGRPGIEASVCAEAVWSWTLATFAQRSIGPAWTSTYCMRP